MKKIMSAALALAMTLSLLPASLAAAGGTAYASTQPVEVDGQKVEFQMYALKDANGNGTNYVKLRDVAHVLNGTKAQFSVGYDNASGSISIATGAAYTDTGTEMTTPYSGDRAYQTGSGAVLVNGAPASLDAIVLTDDNGGGYTYFKLRDLGSALGFNVDWTAERGVIVATGGAAQTTDPSQPTGIVSADGKLSVNDLQGVWSATYGDEEYIISGDQITLLSHSSISDMYRLRQGTITGIEMDVEPTFPGDDNYPYAIKYTYTDQTLLNGKLSNDSSDNGRLSFTEVVPAENYFKHIATRYDRVSSSQLYDTVLAAIEGPRRAEEALSKYPTYAEFKGVPDFGAIFDLPDHTNHGKLDYVSGIDPTWIDFINSIDDKISSQSDITVYTYRTGDAGGYDELLELENQYVQILKECGFMPEIANTAIGGSQLYYTNKTQKVSVSLSWKEKSREQYFPSDFYVTVQSER